MRLFLEFTVIAACLIGGWVVGGVAPVLPLQAPTQHEEMH